MYQLFGLFCAVLASSGVILAFDFFGEKLKFAGLLNEERIRKPAVSLCIGILVGILSLLKLVFSFVIPVVGDILPVLTGMLASLMLLSNYSVLKNEEPAAFFAGIDRIFLTRRNVMGVIVVVVALTHFIFPEVLVL